MPPAKFRYRSAGIELRHQSCSISALFPKAGPFAASFSFECPMLRARLRSGIRDYSLFCLFASDSAILHYDHDGPVLI